MGSQVGSGEVAIVPTFKGFRRSVSSEVDGTAKEATRGFSRLFTKSGTDAGKSTGQGFRKAFEGASEGFSAKATKALEADVAKASRALSTARLKEQDAAGKARIAEAQLNEARQKYADDSSQVIRAQERQETALRNLRVAQERTEESTDDLKRAQGELARSADRASDELSESGRRGGRGFQDSFLGGIRGMGGAIVGAFAAIGLTGLITDVMGQAVSQAFNFVKESITQASTLNESLNAVKVSFGDISGEIDKLAQGSAQRLGLSKADFNGIATQFSSFARTIRSDNPAGFIDELTTRGADFASVFDMEVSEALGLFQSGLAGETEPLRRFGIDLSAASVEAFAYANGIAAAGEPLTEAQKQQARYASLLSQTAATQGDFANTSGELANSQRRFDASLADTQAALGTYLLPGLTQIMEIANTTLLPVLQQVIEQVGPLLGNALAEAAPKFGELITAIAPLIPELVKLATEAIPPMLDLLIAISPLLIDWATNSASLMTFLTGLFDLIKGDVSFKEFADRVLGVGGSVTETAAKVGAFVGTVAGHLASFAMSVKTKIDEAVGFVTSLPGRMLSAVGNLGSLLVSSGRALIQGFIDGINDMLGAAGDAIGGVMEYIGSFLPHSPAERGEFSGAGWRRVREGGRALRDQFVTGFEDGRGLEFGVVGAGAMPAFAGAASFGGSSARFPSTLVLRVGDREFTAYVDERADARAQAASRRRGVALENGWEG